MKSDRIVWVDGLRGVACLCVMLHHFIMGYYPAAYQGEAAPQHFSRNIELVFSQSPAGFLAAGDFWVSVFCMVSGFVIAYQVYRMKDEKAFSRSLLRRYPRLMIPVLVLSIIVFVMLQLDLFYNTQAAYMTGSTWLAQFYQNKTTLTDLFFASFVDTWLCGMTTLYSNAFWMLSELFAGSFMAYLLAAMGRGSNRRIVYVYIGIALAYLSVNSRLTTFVLGVLLAYVILHYGDRILSHKKACMILGIMFLVLAVFLGGYPQGCEPTNGYAVLNHLPDRLNPCYFYHMLAAMLLMISVFLLKPAALFLSAEPIQFLGKISYSIYIIHVPVLFSLSAWLLLQLADLTKDYNVAAGLTLVISVAVVIALGWLFYHLVEKPSVGWSNKLVEKLMEKIEE